MRIGIVGSAERAVAWENHLRPHPSVSEVIIAASLDDIGSVDACLLLNVKDSHIEQLINAIKSGVHTFSIAKLPTEHAIAEKIYYASQEANVCVQFSHWPTLAPASQWMAQKVTKPSFIQVNRLVSHTQFIENNIAFADLWIDELAYCLKYVGGAVHHVDVNTSTLQSGKPRAIHLALRFDSGATAVIYISACAHENRHRRLVSDHTFLLDCEIESQTVRIGRESSNKHLFFDKKTFDASVAAEQSVTQFLKSIQLKKPSVYNSHDLLLLTGLIDRVQSRF